MKTMFRAEYGKLNPVEVTVDEASAAPADLRDSTGVRVLAISHFGDREACWQRMLEDANATVRIRCRQLSDAQGAVTKAEKNLASASMLEQKLIASHAAREKQ